MLIDLRSLGAHLSAVNSLANSICLNLSSRELSWRPEPGKWSIAENLRHLSMTTDIFLPVVDAGVVETRSRGRFSPGPFALDPYGRLLVWYVTPPPVIRLPAPKQLLPLLPGPPENALPEFLAKQEALMASMDRARGLDLTAFRLPSPLASYIRMNLLELLCVVNGHARRHLWQADHVRAALGKPSLD